MAWYTLSHETGYRTQSHMRKPPMSRARRKALLLSYLPDWILTIVLAAIFFSLDNINGFRRQFSIDDATLRFPFATKERVPPTALYFIAIVAPFVIQIIVNLLTLCSLWDFHNSTLGLVLSLSVTGVITQIAKLTVGRPRPDVLSRCQPPAGITNPEYGLVSSAICTNTDIAIMRDGWRSFPSGHSSLSFAGLGFLTFYLAGKTRLYDEKGNATSAWISLTPLAGAVLVAISRTMDYRHHWQDVVTGSLLGLVISFLAYRMYYPPLTSPNSARPFSPRIPREHKGVAVGDGGDDDDVDEAELRDRPILPTTRPLQPRSDGGEFGRSVGGDAAYDDLRAGTSSSSKIPSGKPEPPKFGRDHEILTHPPMPHIHAHMHPQSQQGGLHDPEAAVGYRD